MENLEQKKNLGLLPLPEDKRDFSHHAIYGTLGASQLPTADFTVYDRLAYAIQSGDYLAAIASRYGIAITALAAANPQIVNINRIYAGQSLTIPGMGIVILDQTDLDFCTAYCKCEIAYQEFGIRFDPLHFMAKIKQVRGEYQQPGANLRDAALASVRFGFLPIQYAPYTHDTGGPNDKPRDFLANWANYPAALDSMAARYKMGSFFTLDGTGDAFDNIRSAMQLHRSERRSVDFGLNWRPEWTASAKGLIVDSGYVASSGEGHDGDFIGQKTFPGESEPRLVWQQTWGPLYGDGGLFYFPRSVVNKEFLSGYGSFTYTKLSSDAAAWMIQNGIRDGDSWATQAWKVAATITRGLISNLWTK